jgi:hypothetical protein
MAPDSLSGAANGQAFDDAGDVRNAGNALAPWLAPYAAFIEVLEPGRWDANPGRLLEHLNRLARERDLRTLSGRPLHFVDARASAAPGAVLDAGVAYETVIAETGAVPTRTLGAGARHDLYNALVWLRFPQTKAVLNGLQAAQINRHGVGARRGAVRDAVTLFDENAVVWLCDDPAPARALAAFDWSTLFRLLRDPDAPRVTTWVLGHALLEKLEAPFKAITAHALPLALAADTAPDDVDSALAARWRDSPPASTDFCPLPVMGLPGWCEDNDRPGFYDDTTVFRGGRTRGRRASALQAPARSPNGGMT